MCASMRVFYSDGELMRRGGRLQILCLNAGWCVVGPGYICAVENIPEGLKLLESLKAEGEQRGLTIEYSLAVG